MINDPIVYVDRPEHRELDLRPDGADCIPALGMTKLASVSRAPDQHVHPGCVEIVLCLRGILAFEAGDERYPFLPGSVFVSTARQPHALEDNPRGMTTYRILFAVPKAGAGILGLPVRESEWLARSLTHLPARCFRDASQIRARFRRLFEIHDTMPAHSVARRLKTKAAVIDLLIAVIESARALPYAMPSAVATVVRQMERRPQDDYRLATLARQARIAPVTFSVLFKRATGLPPHAFLLNQRIRKACALLKKDNTPIHAISDIMRFASPQHFSSAFHRAVGKTPSDYRKSEPRANLKIRYQHHRL